MAQCAATSQISQKVPIQACSAKFYNFLKNRLTEIVGIVPQVQSLKLVEGEEGKVGNVKLGLILFVDSANVIPISVRVRTTEYKDEEKTTVGIITEGEILTQYPFFQMTAKVEAETVVWTFQFSKANPIIPDPYNIADAFCQATKKVDEYLRKDN